jgi:tRNA (guanine37-N1)-methyltransferase
MRCDFLTIFPQFYEGPLSQSLVAKARGKGILDVRVHNLRDHAPDRHSVVDDEPYGGGSGMVFKAEPIFRAVRALAAEGERPFVVLPSAQGTPFTQAVAAEFAGKPRLLFICPR